MSHEDQKPVAARGAGAVRATAARGETGAPPSNTAPSQDKGGPIRILRQGIDSLYLSYAGQLTETWDRTLAQLKQLSASRDKSEQASAIAEVGDMTFHVRDKGAGRFKYILNHPDYNLRLSSSMAQSMPLATVQIASLYLTQVSPRTAVARMDSTVARLASFGFAANRVSRVDLCVDFVADWNLLGWDESAWLTRAHATTRHADRGVGTGWTIGAGGDLSFRLYDKTLEIATKSQHRTDVHPIWFEHGWNGVDTVYRAEFQVKREPLKGIQVDDFDSLEPLIGPLWGFLSQKWLRLLVPSDSDSRRSRWPLHPVWSALSELSWPKALPGTAKPVAAMHGPNANYAVRRLRGALTSYMAAEKVAEPDEALRRMYQSVREALVPAARVRGDDPEGLLFDEASAKATKAGLPFESARAAAHSATQGVHRAVHRKHRVKKAADHGEG